MGLAESFARGYQLEMQAQANDALAQERELRRRKILNELVASQTNIDPNVVAGALDLESPTHERDLAKLIAKNQKLGIMAANNAAQMQRMKIGIQERVDAQIERMGITSEESEYIGQTLGMEAPKPGMNRQTANMVASQVQQNRRDLTFAPGASRMVTPEQQAIEAEGIPGLKPGPSAVDRQTWQKQITDVLVRGRGATAETGREAGVVQDLSVALSNRYFGAPFKDLDVTDLAKLSDDKNLRGLTGAAAKKHVAAVAAYQAAKIAAGEMSYEQAIDNAAALFEVEPAKRDGVKLRPATLPDVPAIEQQQAPPSATQYTLPTDVQAKLDAAIEAGKGDRAKVVEELRRLGVKPDARAVAYLKRKLGG